MEHDIQDILQSSELLNSQKFSKDERTSADLVAPQLSYQHSSTNTDILVRTEEMDSQSQMEIFNTDSDRFEKVSSESPDLEQVEKNNARGFVDILSQIGSGFGLIESSNGEGARGGIGGGGGGGGLVDNGLLSTGGEQRRDQASESPTLYRAVHIQETSGRIQNKSGKILRRKNTPAILHGNVVVDKISPAKELMMFPGSEVLCEELETEEADEMEEFGATGEERIDKR